MWITAGGRGGAPERRYGWVVSPSPTRNWRLSGPHDLHCPFPAPPPPPRRVHRSRSSHPLRRCLFQAAPSPEAPPSANPIPLPQPSSSRTIGREPACRGGSGGWMCLCVTGEGGEKGGESRGARERERARAVSEEGGREADPPTWGALAPLQLACRDRESPGEADKCGHIGRRGARRSAHGPRRLRPVQAAPAQPPRSGPVPVRARGAPRSLSRAPRLRPPA